MQDGQASVTALGAAGHRAAHQVLERGFIFADPLALRILGPDADDAIALAKERPERRGLRLFIAMRSRFAEDAAANAIEKGVPQILVLGAGLDTFAYRLEPTQDMRVFELDHPATQTEKRRRLAEAEIAEPAHVSYVAHDFESGSMTAALEAAGLDPDRSAFVLWLGVTPYLTEEAVFATLGELASWPGGTEVVLDYANPPEAVEEPTRATSIGKWRSESRLAASRSDAISIRLNCTPARDLLGSPTSRISIARRWLRAICHTRRSLRGPARAATLCGWRRRRACCVSWNRSRWWNQVRVLSSSWIAF